MADAIVNLLLVALVITAILVIRNVMSERKKKELMLNPPKRAYIEVKLPYTVSDSNKRMQSFYARVRSQAEADSAMRKAGLGTIQAIFIAERPKDGTEPLIRFFLCCDPDKMDTVKSFLRRKFDLILAQIIIHDQDPMSFYFEKLKPQVEQIEDTNSNEEPAAE